MTASTPGAAPTGGAAAVAAGLAERAGDDVARLQSRLRAAQAIERFLSALSTALAEDLPGQALRVIRQGSRPLATLRERSPEAADQVAAMESLLVERATAAMADVPQAFPRAVADAGMTLDRQSRDPKYTLFDGFLTVMFDRKSMGCRVRPRDGRASDVAPDLPVVMATVTGEARRLFDRPFDGDAFHAAISSAYEAAALEAKTPVGEAVPIKDVVKVLSADRAFRADEFNVDLSRLVRSDSRSAQSVRLDHSRDTRNGILLWQLDQRGYYGYIRVGGPRNDGDSRS